MQIKRILASLPFLLVAPPAMAESPLTGTWKVVEAKTAPWFDGKSAQPPTHSEIINAKLVFTDQSVQGPQPIGCAKSKFTVTAVGPEYLFQGGLKNPKKEAAALPGFPFLGCIEIMTFEDPKKSVLSDPKTHGGKTIEKALWGKK